MVVLILIKVQIKIQCKPRDSYATRHIRSHYIRKKKLQPKDAKCYGTGVQCIAPDDHRRYGLDLEAIPEHAGLVLLDHRLALLGGIIGLGEKHAVVAGGLLIFADAAGL